MHKRQSDTELILIRHASTLWNEEGRYQGRRNIPLSPQGYREISEYVVPSEIKDWPLYSSPLTRAVQTAEALFGRTPELVPEAVEQDFGDWEGRLRSELVDKDWKGLDHAPPSGESVRQVQERLQVFLKRFYERSQPGVLVTHKGVLFALVALAFQWNLLGKRPFRLQPHRMQRLEVLPDGQVRVIALNVEFSSK